MRSRRPLRCDKPIFFYPPLLHLFSHTPCFFIPLWKGCEDFFESQEWSRFGIDLAKRCALDSVILYVSSVSVCSVPKLTCCGFLTCRLPASPICRLFTSWNSTLQQHVCWPIQYIYLTCTQGLRWKEGKWVPRMSLKLRHPVKVQFELNMTSIWKRSLCQLLVSFSLSCITSIFLSQSLIPSVKCLKVAFPSPPSLFLQE